MSGVGLLVGTAVRFRHGDAGVDLELPAKAVDAVATVVVLETR